MYEGHRRPLDHQVPFKLREDPGIRNAILPPAPVSSRLSEETSSATAESRQSPLLEVTLTERASLREGVGDERTPFPADFLDRGPEAGLPPGYSLRPGRWGLSHGPIPHGPEGRHGVTGSS